MGLPGHRRTHSDKHRRAAHFALVPIQVTTCEKCKAAVLPHRICKICGWYKGRVAVANADKRLARLAKRSLASHAQVEEAAKAKKADEKKAKKATVKKTTTKSASKANLKKMGSGDK